MQRTWRRRTNALALSAIVAVGAWLRLQRALTAPFWFDEAFTWRLTRFGWGELVPRVAGDTHSPLYFALVKVWTGVFGASVLSLRLPSVFFGTGAIALMYALGVETLDGRRGERAGLVAAALVAVQPDAIYWSAQARMYGLSMALVVLSTLALLRAHRSRRAGAWALYGAVAAAMTYTHYFAFFVVAAQALFVLQDAAIRGRFPRRALVAALVFVVLWLPWAGVAFAQNVRSQASWWAPPITWPGVWWAWFALLVPRLAVSPGALGVGAVDGAILLLLAHLARTGARARLLVLLATVPFALGAAASLVGANVLLTKCLLHVQLPLVACAAVLVARARVPLVSWAVAAALTLFVGARSFAPRRAGEGTDYAAAVATLARTQPGDVVVIDPYDYFPMLRFGGSNRWWIYAKNGVVPSFVGGSILDGEHVTTPHEVVEREERTWLVENNGREGQVPVPRQLRLLSRASFGSVSVLEYGPRRR